MITSPDNDPLLSDFADKFKPLEPKESLIAMSDQCTGARFCECHIKASLLVKFGTTKVPLDPATQVEYKANRDIRVDHKAFVKMKDDAEKGRAFSNIVAEYTTQFDPQHPLKIVGGQHRFEAIEHALAKKVDQYHGVKVYFNLNKEQRMDVQLISNTTIAVTKALIDRMIETALGSDLRSWCHAVGLLSTGKDFSDRPARGTVYVRLARTFVTNYFNGKNVHDQDYGKTRTTPVICPSGATDEAWIKLLEENPDLFKDQGLIEAGKHFVALVDAQRDFFDQKVKADLPDKALNIALVAAWAYVAGVLSKNNVRLKNHFSLSKEKKHDPLNAEKLAKGRFKFDPPNYRGLGNRTDAKEAGRFAELFWMQAEKGEGIKPAMIQKAINKYEIKILSLDNSDE